jgi:hypothetical protein
VVLREFQLAVAVRGPHHRDVAADSVEPDGLIREEAFDPGPAFALDLTAERLRHLGAAFTAAAEPAALRPPRPSEVPSPAAPQALGHAARQPAPLAASSLSWLTVTQAPDLHARFPKGIAPDRL